MDDIGRTDSRHPPKELDAEAQMRSGDYPLLRPKDASTLILIDRSGREPALLMGKRHKAHAFMPETYVFPGGRRDRDDGRVPVADRLHPLVEKKLQIKMANPASAFRAQALAIAAVRETHEEVGLFIAGKGRTCQQQSWKAFAARELAPRLSPLRYVARAITPPRQKRRFDTRFFACFRDEIGQAEAESSNELLDLIWVGLSEVDKVEMPRITRVIIADLKHQLDNDPSLAPGQPVPFYQARYGRFTREML